MILLLNPITRHLVNRFRIVAHLWFILQETFRHRTSKFWIDIDIPFFQCLVKKVGLPKVGFHRHRHVCIFLDEKFIHVHENFRFWSQFTCDHQLFFLFVRKYAWGITNSQTKDHNSKSRKNGPQLGLFHPFQDTIEQNG